MQRKFEDEELIAFYGQGKSDSEMAREFKVSRSAIKQRRDKLGLKSNFTAYAKRDTRKKTKPKAINRIHIEPSDTRNPDRERKIKALEEIRQRVINRMMGAL